MVESRPAGRVFGAVSGSRPSLVSAAECWPSEGGENERLSQESGGCVSDSWERGWRRVLKCWSAGDAKQALGNRPTSTSETAATTHSLPIPPSQPIAAASQTGVFGGSDLLALPRPYQDEVYDNGGKSTTFAKI